jgi:hypothetical protein
MTAVRPRRRRRAAVGDAGQVARELLTVRAMSVPFARGLGGRQGARAVNSERADLDDLPSALVGLVLGVALQAESRRWGRLWLSPYTAGQAMWRRYQSWVVSHRRSWGSRRAATAPCEAPEA